MQKRNVAQPIRVLLVEDSWSQRELLVSVLRAGGFEVVGIAGDGQAAIESAQRLRPDVIAMDIHLPVLDGYRATDQIMQSCPTPIVMVSASGGDAGQRSMQALSAGALAVVQKPGSPRHPDFARDRDALLMTLGLMADVPVVTRFPQRRALDEWQAPAHASHHLSGSTMPRLVAPAVLAVAASTGGPMAVQAVLQDLGPAFPLPVLLVQHIAHGFVGPLVEWLNSASPLPLRVASDGERLLLGTAYLAPEGHHLAAANGGRAALRPSAASDRYAPSADVLFESVAQVYGPRGVGVIMTGMGDDGAHGLRLLHSAGGYTIGQDEASCIVYGMPKAAAQAGALSEVAPLNLIAPSILRLIGVAREIPDEPLHRV